MNGRVALVAGASKGIGAATAEAFAAAGAAVVLGSRDIAALEAVAGRIRSRGGQALATYLDVTDADSMRAVVDQTRSTFGRLDAAFNNAAAGPLPAPLADIDPAEFDLGIATHIRGTFLGMKFQIPAMLDSGGGAIVNMASIAGLNGTANLAARRRGQHPRPAAERPVMHLVPERAAPEVLGSLAIGNAQHHHAEREHGQFPFSASPWI